jgi:hypothetical protein
MDHRSKAFSDLLAISLGAGAVFAVSATFDIFNKIVTWLTRHDTWELDELFTVAIYLVVAIGFYAWRRNKELRDQIRQRIETEQANARLIPELESTRADLTRLRTLLPLCSGCGRVREGNGDWAEVEDYLERHLRMRLDNGLCPDCAREFYAKPGWP